MAQTAVDRSGRDEASVIDRAHLRRMTFGDECLERDLLRLFDTQSAMLLDRMRRSEPAVAAALAHTLRGSALGIGAFAVARAAEALERTGAGQGAMLRLALAVEEARAAVARLLAPPLE